MDLSLGTNQYICKNSKPNHNMRKFLLLLLLPIMAQAQSDSTQRWMCNMQVTYVTQYAMNNPKQIGYNTAYSTGNTFIDNKSKSSLSSTLFLGTRLWKGAELYVNPEVAGGQGIGGTLGIAGYPNGEIFRVGDPTPTLYVARAFLRQTIKLNTIPVNSKGDDREYVKADQTQLSGFTSSKRLVFTVGKFTLADIFDNNHYSHDSRTRLLNWSLMSAGAYDFASDTKGYTYAAVGEYISPEFSIRFGTAMEPMYANGPMGPHKFMDLEAQTGNGIAYNYEIEKPFNLNKHKPSIFRALFFFNKNHSGEYALAQHGGSFDSIYFNNATKGMNQVRSKTPSAVKYGIVLGLQQPISEHAGMFSRISWNDGHTESWAFAEIDNSITAGFVFHCKAWHRFNDRLTIGLASNGISKDHQTYLAAGGYGFMLGDGKLNYGREGIIEVQYEWEIKRGFILSPDYQLISNPGYNKANGTISVFGIRSHIELYEY